MEARQVDRLINQLEAIRLAIAALSWAALAGDSESPKALDICRRLLDESDQAHLAAQP